MIKDTSFASVLECFLEKSFKIYIQEQRLVQNLVTRLSIDLFMFFSVLNKGNRFCSKNSSLFSSQTSTVTYHHTHSESLEIM